LQRSDNGAAHTLQTSTQTAETIVVVVLLCFAAFGLVGLLAVFNHHWSQQSYEQEQSRGFVSASPGFEPAGSLGALPGDSARSLTTGARGGPGGAPFGTGGPPPPQFGGRSSPFETTPDGSLKSVPPPPATTRSTRATPCC